MKKIKSVFKGNPSLHTTHNVINKNPEDSKKLTQDISNTDKLTLKVSRSNSSNVNQDIEEADYEILGTDNKIDKKNEKEIDKIYTKLCPKGSTTIVQLNICKNLMANMYSVIHRLEKDLKKFRSKKENLLTPIDIYVDLLRVSDKIPTCEALELASWKRISKSTWDRRLNEFSFLVPLIDKVEKLINKTKNTIRKNFYIDCLLTLYESHDNLEILHTNVKFEMQDGIILDKNGKEIERIVHETDKIQFEDFMRRNGYLKIDEKIDKELENKSEDKI